MVIFSRKKKSNIGKVNPRDATPSYIDGEINAGNRVVPRPFESQHFRRRLKRQVGSGRTVVEAIQNSNKTYDPKNKEYIDELNRKRYLRNRVIVFREKALSKYKIFSKNFKEKFDKKYIEESFYVSHLFVKNDEDGVRRILREYSQIYTWELTHRYIIPDRVSEYVNSMERRYGDNSEKEIRIFLFDFWYKEKYTSKEEQLPFKNLKVKQKRKDGVIQHYWKNVTSPMYRRKMKLSRREMDAYYNLWKPDKRDRK